MENHKSKPYVQAAPADLQYFQDFPGNGHAKAGIKQGEDLEIFKGQLFRYAQPDVKLQPQIRKNVVQGRVVVGKQLVGI